jgi:hypothetical protein
LLSGGLLLLLLVLHPLHWLLHDLAGHWRVGGLLHVLLLGGLLLPLEHVEGGLVLLGVHALLRRARL